MHRNRATTARLRTAKCSFRLQHKKLPHKAVHDAEIRLEICRKRSCSLIGLVPVRWVLKGPKREVSPFQAFSCVL